MGVHHLLTGSYTTTNLYLLAFDAVMKTLSINATIPGFGLHQYVGTNQARDRVYATAMSEPPRLFSWSVSQDWQFEHLNTINITTSSCYVSDDGEFAFSAGGNGARVNILNSDGSLGDTVQEMFYVPKQEMAHVDKTRAAVLYGAHGFDVNVNGLGFVPHLEWDAIFMYDIQQNGTSELLSINLSPEAGDGPRNSLPSKDGRLLYVITEHSQYVDVYSICGTQLQHMQRASAIPDDVRGKYTYRSNRVEISRDGKYLFSSTRGWNNTEANGWVGAFELNAKTGLLASEEAVTFYEAPLTLGSAGGMRVAFWEDASNADPAGITDYMYLSDTSEGVMYVLGWTPSTKTLAEVASVQYPGGAAPYEAVWLD